MSPVEPTPLDYKRQIEQSDSLQIYGESYEFNHQGKIIAYLGPMRSSKSAELIRSAHVYELGGSSILLINHFINKRDENKVKSRNGMQCECDMVSDLLSPENMHKCLQYDVIGIDEIQFFDHIDTFCRIMHALGKIIILAGLSANYKGEMFESVTKVFPLIHELHMLKAVCKDCPFGKNREAIHNVRKKSIKDSIETLVGDEQYLILCDQCRHEHQKNLVTNR